MFGMIKRPNHNPSPNRPDRKTVDSTLFGPTAQAGAILRHFAFTLAICAIVAGMTDEVFRAATVSFFLFINAIAAAVMALIKKVPMFPPYFSRWDQAATLYIASQIAGFFVDIEALQKVLDTLQAAQ